MKHLQRMNESKQLPLISIGMPVRNEARFLRQALDCLVNQRAVSFEIIISDNASTDTTSDICLEYVQRYPLFIRYHRFETNVGASSNFAWVLEQATGKFFMWASGHDLWDDNYLQECSQALADNPAAMIAFGTSRWIDAEGKRYPRDSGWSDTRGLSLIGRYMTVFWGSMNPVIALIRTSALKQQKIIDMVGLDLCILLGLALRGDFIHCTQTAWARREFRVESSYQQKLERYRSTEYALGKSWLAKHFPLAQLPLRILGDVVGADIPFGQKMMLAVILCNSLPVKYLADKKRKRQGH